MNDPDSFLDRRADADNAPDGAGPREPYECDGMWTMDGVLFYTDEQDAGVHYLELREDWAHKRLATLEAELAARDAGLERAREHIEVLIAALMAADRALVCEMGPYPTMEDRDIYDSGLRLAKRL